MALDLIDVMLRKLRTAEAALVDLRAHVGNESTKTARAILAVDVKARTATVKRGPYKTKAKRLHWSQTAAGKRKLSKISKARWAVKRGA